MVALAATIREVGKGGLRHRVVGMVGISPGHQVIAALAAKGRGIYGTQIQRMHTDFMGHRFSG